MLGAVGSLATKVLTTDVPALTSHIINKKKNQVAVDDPKYKEILQSKLPKTTAVTNMIGSGVQRRGAEIKRF